MLWAVFYQLHAEYSHHGAYNTSFTYRSVTKNGRNIRAVGDRATWRPKRDFMDLKTWSLSGDPDELIEVRDAYCKDEHATFHIRQIKDRATTSAITANIRTLCLTAASATYSMLMPRGHFAEQIVVITIPIRGQSAGKASSSRLRATPSRSLS